MANQSKASSNWFFCYDSFIDVVLFLYSAEACRLHILSKSCKLLLSDMTHTSLSASGCQSKNGLWVHGIAGWQLIRDYLRELQSVKCLDEFHFSKHEDVQSALAAVLLEKHRAHRCAGLGLIPPRCYLTQWKFDASKVKALIQGKRILPVRSEHKMFCCEAVKFEVALLLQSSGEGEFSLKWQAVFLEGSAEAEVLDAEVSGGIIAPNFAENAPSILQWSPPCTPRACNHNEMQPTYPTNQLLDDAILGMLKDGTSLPCFLRIGLSMQGMTSLHVMYTNA